MAFQDTQGNFVLQVPYTYGSVIGSGDCPPSIRRQCYSLDTVTMAVKDTRWLVAPQVPHAYGLVPRSRNDPPSIS